MVFESDKTMFEIYREKDFNRKFRVVYYTELNEHNKESEINRALNGETIFDGFVADNAKEKAKAAIKEMLTEMNSSKSPMTRDEITRRLAGCLA